MIQSGQHIRVVTAGVGAADCGALLAAMRAAGWAVDVAADAEAMATVAGVGHCHLAVLATDAPAELPRQPVRALMSLQADMAVLFLVPDRNEVLDCPALLGATSDQVQNLDAPVAELMALIEVELRSVLLTQPGYTVLCIDDDEEFLTSLEAFLPRRLLDAFPRFQLDFEFFDSPLEALSATEAMDPDDSRLAVVICDQVMPRMTGIELLTRLKERFPDAQRVLLTGYAGLDSAITAINERVLDKYLAKPIEQPVDFANSIQRLLHEYHLRLSRDAQRRRLMAQFEFIRAIGAAPDVDRALAATVQFVSEQTHARQVMALVLDGEDLLVRAGIGPPPALRVGARLAASDAFGRWALGQRRVAVIAEWDDLPPGVDLPAAAALPLMALPLAWNGQSLGLLLAAGRRTHRPFARHDEMLMGFAADAAAVTVGGLKDRDSIQQHYVHTMASLMEAVEAKDRYTRGHTDRVTKLAVRLAKAVGLAGQDIEDIERAAALHDIGKIAIPDAIIHKPGRLSADEYARIQEHPGRGDRILQHLSFLDRARRIVRHHHERYDGKGYPDGLSATDIPVGARILAIADCYDAMTSDRPYRQAMAPGDAMAEIEVNAGKQFDPDLANAFLEIVKDRKAPEPLRMTESKPVAAQE